MSCSFRQIFPYLDKNISLCPVHVFRHILHYYEPLPLPNFAYFGNMHMGASGWFGLIPPPEFRTIFKPPCLSAGILRFRLIPQVSFAHTPPCQLVPPFRVRVNSAHTPLLELATIFATPPRLSSHSKPPPPADFQPSFATNPRQYLSALGYRAGKPGRGGTPAKQRPMPCPSPMASRSKRPQLPQHTGP